MFDFAAKMSGQEREEFYVSFSRGFKPGESFIDRFRFKPCAPMLSFIYLRMQQFDPKVFEGYMRKYFVNLFTPNLNYSQYRLLKISSLRRASTAQGTRPRIEHSGSSLSWHPTRCCSASTYWRPESTHTEVPPNWPMLSLHQVTRKQKTPSGSWKMSSICLSIGAWLTGRSARQLKEQ